AKDWYGCTAASIGKYCHCPLNRLPIVPGQCLCRREECEIEHFVFGTTAGEIVHRLVQTLKDRSVCFKAPETLCNLVADVARFKCREFAYICTAVLFRSRRFLLSYTWYDRRINLMFTIYCCIWQFFFGVLLCKFHFFRLFCFG